MQNFLPNFWLSRGKVKFHPIRTAVTPRFGQVATKFPLSMCKSSPTKAQAVTMFRLVSNR